MTMLRRILLGAALTMGVVGSVTLAPPLARADYALMIYGPYATAEDRDAAAGSDKSWTGGYLTSPPPGVPGVRVVGYKGPGFYFWYD